MIRLLEAIGIPIIPVLEPLGVPVIPFMASLGVPIIPRLPSSSCSRKQARFRVQLQCGVLMQKEELQLKVCKAPGIYRHPAAGIPRDSKHGIVGMASGTTK